MQPERQISIFCLMVGGALVYPEVRELAQHPEMVPGGALMTGGFFGAVGVFFGTLLALDGGHGWFKAILAGFWGLAALAFAAAMQWGALRSPGPVRLGLFEAFSLLCLLAFFGTLYGVYREERRSKA
ncbi:MAG: hypothetical protein ACM3ZT_03570 [Bacillota bacterium]